MSWSSRGVLDGVANVFDGHFEVSLFSIEDRRSNFPDEVLAWMPDGRKYAQKGALQWHEQEWIVEGIGVKPCCWKSVRSRLR